MSSYMYKYLFFFSFLFSSSTFAYTVEYRNGVPVGINAHTSQACMEGLAQELLHYTNYRVDASEVSTRARYVGGNVAEVGFRVELFRQTTPSFWRVRVRLGFLEYVSHGVHCGIRPRRLHELSEVVQIFSL